MSARPLLDIEAGGGEPVGGATAHAAKLSPTETDIQRSEQLNFSNSVIWNS
jgi:hypothetical protein